MFVAGAVILGRGIGRLVVGGRYGLSGVVVALLQSAMGYLMVALAFAGDSALW